MTAVDQTQADPRATRPEPVLTFKIADQPWEFEQIYALNYQTFVEEIPQHPVNPDGRLVDKFDAENTYLICLDGRHLVGMICVRGNRPFSLDHKLENLDSYLPPARKICEYRLLSVSPAYRTGRVLLGLVAEVVRYCLEQGYDLALISGTTRQLKLYRALGFVPFGPLVGEPGAQFQPMYLTPDNARQHIFPRVPAEITRDTPPDWPAPANGHAADVPAQAVVNLLPGPVGVADPVREALAAPPLSHRAESFTADFVEIKRRLRELVNARHVDVLMGSGTLANDAVGGQLLLLGGRGLVISNGEFGDRLIDHATRFGLDFEAIRVPWGSLIPERDLFAAVDRMPALSWIWAVHCETSTGVLNDIEMLKRAAASRQIPLCLDCISSIGVVPIDLTGVYLASCVSGKGLAAVPGLSMVFSDHEIAPAPTRLPRYLDLGVYASGDGVPYTMSSNLLAALHRALDRVGGAERFAEIASLSDWLRQGLEAAGYAIVAPSDAAAPAVLTIALPPTLDSNEVGARLRDAGYLLSYQSSYLLDRNWIQICLMGADLPRDRLAPLLALLPRVASLPSQ